MAEYETEGQEKTLDPSEKRLREAREQGQVVRSRELATAAVFGAGVLAMLALGAGIASGALEWMQQALNFERAGEAELLPAVFASRLWTLLLLSAPIMLTCVLASLVAPIVVGRLNFSGKVLVPDFSKLDPIRGLGRIYGREGAAELVRSMLRVLVIGGVGSLTMMNLAPKLIALLHSPMPNAAIDGFGMAFQLLLALAGGVFLLAAVDVPWQIYSHRQKLRMSLQELRDELKESEGSPEIKARIRRLQQEMAQRRMMEAVPGADVLIVNPTHYAVALKYDPGKMKAPRLVAKGVDEVAATLRFVAESHKVPLITAPALARTLYAKVQIGREIPVNLYAAIAQVLTYVYQLRQWRRQGGRSPELPNIEIPDESSRA